MKDPYAVEYEEALVRQMMITASRGMRLYQKAAEEPAGLYQEFQELRLKMLSHYEKGLDDRKALPDGQYGKKPVLFLL